MPKKQFTTKEKRRHKAEKKSEEESKSNTAPKVEKAKYIYVKVRRFDDIDDYDWPGTADDL